MAVRRCRLDQMDIVRIDYRWHGEFSEDRLLLMGAYDDASLAREERYSYKGGKVDRITKEERSKAANGGEIERSVSSHERRGGRLVRVGIRSLMDGNDGCTNFHYLDGWIFIRKCGYEGMDFFRSLNGGEIVKTGFIPKSVSSLAEAEREAKGVQVYYLSQERLVTLERYIDAELVSSVSFTYDGDNPVRSVETIKLSTDDDSLAKYMAVARVEPLAGGGVVICDYLSGDIDTQGNPTRYTAHCAVKVEQGVTLKSDYELRLSVTYADG